MKLEGKRIVITGAASGIGKALVQALAGIRCRILAADVDGVRLAALVSSFTAPRAEIHAFPCDLSLREDNEKLFDAARERMGGIDVYVANAGFALHGRRRPADWDELDALMRVNVVAPVFAAQRMRELNRGREYKVVITASAMAFWALPGYAAYAASKAALHRFAEGFRFEVDDPRRLMVVYPIATRTRFFGASLPEAPQPWPAQTPEHVARAVLRGIERDARAVFPSPVFPALLAADRVLPAVRAAVQMVERLRLDRWERRGPAPAPTRRKGTGRRRAHG